MSDLHTVFTRVLGEDRVETYLHGACDVFAVALHLETGLPLYATLDEDYEIGQVLVHAYVMQAQQVIDARGVQSYGAMLQHYETWEPYEGLISVADLLEIGGGTMEEVEALRPCIRQALAGLDSSYFRLEQVSVKR